jgi:tRNA nucleotidyltransferase/poly(A) polymerase
MATDSRKLRFDQGASGLPGFFSELSYSVRSTPADSNPALAMLADTATIENAFGNKSGEPRAQNSRHNRPGPGRRNLSSKSASGSRVDITGPPVKGYGVPIELSDDEKALFGLLRRVREETGISTTLRVAGGWVRDKLLATKEYQTYHKVFEVGSESQRLQSKFHRHAPSMGRHGAKVLGLSGNASEPVDIDIALDDMLGRAFADHLNEYLVSKGEDTVSVGVVLRNPEKSKHLETATMKVGSFWIDFVNLRAEEYTQDSRIPDLMRIGTPAEDAFRRDLTINALFYNINTGEIEDWTGRGLEDLRKGIVATPLPPLTTILDDPLRVLRSVRFAARLRFVMDEELVDSAKEESVRFALAQKVSRERVGGELDLMLRSPDPVCAMRLLLNLELVSTVIPISQYIPAGVDTAPMFRRGLALLSTAHDYLADCKWSPPLWCQNKKQIYGDDEVALKDDEHKRRLLWYASFLKPLHDYNVRIKPEETTRRAGQRTSRSVVATLLVNDIKRPIRDAETIEQIMTTADELTQIVESGHYVSAIMILLSDVQVSRRRINNDDGSGTLQCFMSGRLIDSTTEDDPVWHHAMEFRELCAPVIKRIGVHWRAALFLAVSEQLADLDADGLEYVIEGDLLDESREKLRQGIIEKYDAFATALQEVGLIGIQYEKPLLCGQTIKKILTKIPQGPAFREVMDAQTQWMTVHPGTHVDALKAHLKQSFPEYI